MNEDLLSPADIESEASGIGLSMAEVCRRAGIAQSTFARWKAGKTEPTLDVYRKLRDVVIPTVSRSAYDPALPLSYEQPPTGRYGVAEHSAPFQFSPSVPSGRGYSSGNVDAEAMAILVRIDRELLVEEARVNRLLRQYGL